MSKEIYGFADLPVSVDPERDRAALAKATPLGVFSIDADHLFGFPPDLQPDNHSLLFAIGDSPESTNAEYLLDHQDYDPQSDIQLPLNADERLSFLADLLYGMFSILKCTRVSVCLTQCNEVDEVQHIAASEIRSRLKTDCAVESPPCKIYVVTRDVQSVR